MFNNIKSLQRKIKDKQEQLAIKNNKIHNKVKTNIYNNINNLKEEKFIDKYDRYFSSRNK